MMSCILWPLGFNRWYSLHSFQLTLRVLSLSMLTILKGKVFLQYINKNYTLQLDLPGEGSLKEDFFKWHMTVMMNFKRVQMSLTASVNKNFVQLNPHPDNKGFSKSWLLAVYPCLYKTTYCCLFSLPDSSCVLVSPFGTFSVPILWVQLPITPSEAAYGIKYWDPWTNYKPWLDVTQDMCLLQQKCISEVLKVGVIFVFH